MLFSGWHDKAELHILVGGRCCCVIHRRCTDRRCQHNANCNEPADGQTASIHFLPTDDNGGGPGGGGCVNGQCGSGGVNGGPGGGPGGSGCAPTASGVGCGSGGVNAGPGGSPGGGGCIPGVGCGSGHG